jgi:hypothetical protein
VKFGGARSLAQQQGASQTLGAKIGRGVAKAQKWAADHPRTMSGVKAGIAGVGTAVAVTAIVLTAPVSVPTTLVGGAIAGLSTASLGIGAAGGFVATVTYATGAISGETKNTTEAGDAVNTLTSPSGMGTFLGTGGNIKAASRAADFQDIMFGGPEKAIPATINQLMPAQ